MFGSEFVQDTEVLLNAVLAFGILNLFVCLYFINKYFEKRRAFNKLKNKLNHLEIYIQEFLDEQFDNTNHFKRRLPKLELNLHKEVVALRKAYLKIERSALNHKPDDHEYWRILNDQLYKLIKIMFPEFFGKNRENKEFEQKVAKTREKIEKLGGKNRIPGRKRMFSVLDNLSKKHNSAGADKSKIDSQLDKINALVSIYEDPKLRSNYLTQRKAQRYTKKQNEQTEILEQNASINQTSIEKIEASDSNEELVVELERFKKENTSLTSHLEALKAQLKDLNTQIAEHSAQDIIDSGKTKENLNEVTDELLEANEKEIDRLRTVVKSQRQSIMDMEEKVHIMEKGNLSGENTEEIDKLKRSIKESEVCIEILENELAELKGQLDQIKDQQEEEYDEAHDEELSIELEELQKKLQSTINDQQQQQDLIDSVDELLTASSVEDISLLIFDAVKRINYNPSILITTPQRELEVSKSGQLSIREKVLINNLGINESNPNSNGSLSFRFEHIGGVLRPIDEAEASEASLDHLISLCKSANKIIHLLVQAQKSKKTEQTLAATIDSIKHTSLNLDKDIEKNAKNIVTLVAESVEQIKEVARTKGLSLEQILPMSEIGKEVVNDLEAENIIRLKARKHLLNLINEIEKQIES